MSFYPDLPSSDPRKDAILSRCPFTTTFLDKKATMDPNAWQQKLTETSSPIHHTFEEKLGKNYQSDVILPLSIPLQQSGVFNRAIPIKAKVLAALDIISFGYEIGNREDINLLTPEILVRLYQAGVLDPQMRKTPDGLRKASEYVSGLISVGLYYHLRWENKDNSSKPTAFDDFIDGLDF